MAKTKSFSKGKGGKSWQNKHNKATDVRLPKVLFFWLQPPSEESTPWHSLWPDTNSFDTYIDPFLGNGMGWSRAGESVSKFYVNDFDAEYISALRTVVRGDPNLRAGLREWVRLVGIMDEWAAANIQIWHMFHVEQFKNNWQDTSTIRSKAYKAIELSLQKILAIQSKDFPHQTAFFEEAAKASIVAVLKKCQVLALQNNAALPPETLVIELNKAMRYLELIYAQKLYQISSKVGNFVDPHHALTYLMLHSIAKQDEEGQWKLRPTVPFDVYDKGFKTFESPLIQTLGRQTHFSHADFSLFLKGAPQGEETFTFAHVPENLSNELFGQLYDSIWQREGQFLIIAPADMAETVRHNGPNKSWTVKGKKWQAMMNYGQNTVSDSESNY